MQLTLVSFLKASRDIENVRRDLDVKSEEMERLLEKDKKQARCAPLGKSSCASCFVPVSIQEPILC